MLLEKQSGTTTATYTYGNALIRKDGETPLYDGLGSARAETNSSQAVTSTLTPDAFGNSVTTTGSTASSYGFAATSGYRTDGDAGLMKVGCRYYDPQVGTFTTRDTYLDQKPYLYCEHDPVNGVDPSGHNPAAAALMRWGLGAELGGGGPEDPVGDGIALAFVAAAAIVTIVSSSSNDENRVARERFKGLVGRYPNRGEQGDIHGELGKRKFGWGGKDNPNLPDDEVEDAVEGYVTIRGLRKPFRAE